MALIRAGLTLDLSGLAALSSLAKQRAATLKAVRAGAKIVQQAAKARAPRRKGKGGGGLRQSIGIKAVKGSRGKSLALAVIGARKKVVRMIPRGKKMVKSAPAFYAHLVESGTRPHAIRKGAALGRKGGAAKGQSGGMHPGAKAQPFLGPAWESTRDRAIAEAHRVLGDAIRAVLGKAASKGK